MHTDLQERQKHFVQFISSCCFEYTLFSNLIICIIVIVSFGSFIYYYQLLDLKRSFHLTTVFNSLFFLVKCLQANVTLQAVQRNGMQSRSLAIPRLRIVSLLHMARY